MAGFLSRLAEQARGSAAVARPLILQMMGAGPRMAESLASLLGGRFHSEAGGNGAGDFEANIERVIGTDNPVLNSEGIEPRLPTAEESLRPARDPHTTITGTTTGSFLPNAYRSQPSQAEDLHSDPHAAPALPGGAGATRDHAGRRVSLDSVDRRLRIPAETRRVVPAEAPRAGDLLTAGERSTTREELGGLQPEHGDHVRPAGRGNGDGARSPVIHVTIGRVDVRAILPSPPVARSGPTSPQLGLTLEEYAKQRNRRAR